jgi:hypothetical protein
MRTTKDMTAGELIATWNAITDPTEALLEVQTHIDSIGTDPRTQHLDDALMAMVDRVLDLNSPTSKNTVSLSYKTDTQT